MTWIALKMLVGDRAKFVGIVIGLTFAAALIMQQGSIFCGLMMRTCAQISDIKGADLWVMDPSVRFVDDVKPMLESNLQRVRGVDGVKWAVPLYKGNGRAKLVFSPADMKARTYPAEQLEADRRAPHGPPSNPFTKVLDFLVPGIESPPAPPARWHDTDLINVIEQVIVLGVDDSSMVGAPERNPMIGPTPDGKPNGKLLVGDLEDLRRPDSIIVDRVGLRKLFPGCHLDEPFESPRETDEAYLERLRRFVAAAPEIEMNDHRAILVGVCEATRTFQSNPVAYTLYSRARQYLPMERKVLSFILVQTADGPDGTKIPPAVVAERIQEQTGLGARTSENFMYRTIKYYLVYTGIPINFGITVFLGFLVGTAIAGQTFYNFTIENLKQFGALKAMGASNLRIVGMILLQAATAGLLGYGIGVGLSTLFGLRVATGWHGQPAELAYLTPWQLLPTTAAAIIAICVLASLISVQRVIRLEPAIVFRS
ncbi:FtsX-like permease family protein [Aquisphaera giovannonii]|uniref:FtsX-like permease family protein n=1 Tax=Aquisphaera giovannonii TaxID=406548 RepID=A0A5B9W6J0_9BACT|nr:ABC transporter permease [Aquisphaera giovannonii]QEH36272.1 FtsX-like permease family protein [Aquisphaera giovannonii]